MQHQDDNGTGVQRIPQQHIRSLYAQKMRCPLASAGAPVLDTHIYRSDAVIHVQAGSVGHENVSAL